MFKIEPITTTNIIALLQVLAVAIGFVFTYISISIASKSLDTAARNLDTATKSLDISTKNAQAQLFNQLAVQGRDLQFKFLENFHDSDSDEDKKIRKETFMGALIGYYAACFALRGILALPEYNSKLMDEDLRAALRDEAFRDHWDRVKHFHSTKFGAYVESLRGFSA